ncbi:HGxxPAAW family protein [Streptomyces sp. DSM 41972]|uniref:HGxxPAAW family protein n=1 Tax=Streptomyces althioticus subsp. attaecolombicae TaxID=3075534 RepID=A0ABU3I1G1_9ACTN|nr:HGxxPAAW family protein [Streptomyces sp. DSM 41972]
MALAGTALLGVGVRTVSGPLLAAGAAVDVLAMLVTWALHLAKWGKASGPRPREEWSRRVPDSGAREGHAECLRCRMAGRRGGTAVAPARPVTSAPAAPAETDAVGVGG